MSIQRARTGSKPFNRARSWLKGLVIGLLLLVSVGGYTLFRVMERGPGAEAAAVLKQVQSLIVFKQDWMVFEPPGIARMPSVIFYPGGLVAPESYAPLASKLAEAGHRVYVVRMPFDLAVLRQDLAKVVLGKAIPGERFVIGGHSLGGAMASRYASAHFDELEGVFFLGAYADAAGDLSRTNLSVLQITASQDEVMNRATWERSRKYLPPVTSYIEVKGGNHGGFGDYGKQPGNGTASITQQEQRETVASAMVDWMSKLRKN